MRLLIAVVVVLLFRFVHPGSLDVHSVVAAALGTAIVLGGLGFAVWARIHIGRNWGMPMSQKEEPELVTSGPYRLRPPPDLHRRPGRGGGHGPGDQPARSGRRRDLGRLLLVLGDGRGTEPRRHLPARLSGLQGAHEDADPVLVLSRNPYRRRACSRFDEWGRPTARQPRPPAEPDRPAVHAGLRRSDG